MIKLQNGKLTHVEYEKATNAGSGKIGEITERYIIPTFVPQPNIKALDVTDLDDDEREYIASAYSEYAEYVATVMKSMSTFETWLELAKQDTETASNIKWRTFRTENLTLLG